MDLWRETGPMTRNRLLRDAFVCLLIATGLLAYEISWALVGL
jgi:hypothetical protein